MTSRYLKTCFIVLTVLMTSTGCFPQSNLQQLCKSLVQKDPIDEEYLYSKLKSMGKESIPYLIEVIDVKEKGFVGFQDIKSSTLYPVHVNYCGIIAAYMIERLLANQDSKKLFNLCVIVKLKDNKPEMNSMSYEDMKDIKKIYLDWWKENKSKSNLELSKEWGISNNTLKGSNYIWK